MGGSVTDAVQVVTGGYLLVTAGNGLVPLAALIRWGGNGGAERPGTNNSGATIFLTEKPFCFSDGGITTSLSD